MKPIYNYLDYREYLRDFYNARKEESPIYSYRLMGRLLNIDASYLVKVLQGKHHISDQTIPHATKACRLQGRQADYFTTLVLFSKARSHEKSRFYFEKLLSYKRVPVIELIEGQYEYFSTWYHVAIRSLLDFWQKDMDFKKLGRKLSPPIPEQKARKSVELLEKLNLISKGTNGRYSLTDKHVSTKRELRHLAVRAFQKATIELAVESIERHEPSERDISTLTMAIDEEALERIRHILEECRATIIKQIDSVEHPTRVYQLNMQVFPLTVKGDA